MATSGLGKDFIRSKIDELWRNIEARGERVAAPVNLETLFEYCGIIEVDYRPMIPEGVLRVEQEGFSLFIQSNFRKQANSRRRERFTVAHEICHTFFYDREVSPPKKIRGAPRGQRLESLCNFGAGVLLVPDQLLPQVNRNSLVITCLEDVRALTSQFEVSIDVMLRRLKGLRSICEPGIAFANVALGQDGRGTISSVYYDDLLRTITTTPEVGRNFGEWAEAISPELASSERGSWKIQLPTGKIVARREPTSAKSWMVEIHPDFG